MKRPFLLLYGFIVYLLFNAAFLYWIGFLLDFGVPKAINDGVVVSTTEALLTNLALVFLFGFFHSLMARDGFKRWWTRYIPVEAERSTYVLQSALFLYLAMWHWRPMPDVIWQVEGAAAIVMTALCLIGFMVLFVSTLLIDHFELFGIKQVWFANAKRELPTAEFKQPLLYKLVRHPMQLGVLIAVFATPTMTVGHLVFAASMGLYVLIGLYFEERALLREFGDTYREYQRTTPMLIPRLIPLRQRDPGTSIDAAKAAGKLEVEQ